MDSENPSASSPQATVTTIPVASAPPSWPWLRTALILAGAAQLITISALVSADPLAATWSSLLLATAPAPLAAVTAFAPAPVGRLAAVVTVLVLAAGIAGAVLHTGLFFVPALVVLIAGAIRLWGEQRR